MTFRLTVAAATATALLAALSLLPATASARGHKTQVREFTGTVTKVARGGRSFRLRRAGRAAVRVRVARATKFAKGAGPRAGRKLMVKARHERHGWLARSVKLVPVVVDDEPVGDPLGDDEFTDDPLGDEGDDGILDDLDEPVDDLLGSPDEEE
jgi:hypothetical protein